MGRLSFALRLILNYGSDQRCPFCNSAETKALERKQALLVLRKCSRCHLMYRWPKDTASRNWQFYQRAYKQSGITTDLPDEEEIMRLRATRFAGTDRDFVLHIAVLKALCPAERVLDFGCSWGYGTFQLKQAGYDVLGFEISKPRADFGRHHLGVEIIDDLSALEMLPDAGFDAIYASHVLEHLTSLREPFALFSRLLKPGGVLFIMVPNCGGD